MASRATVKKIDIRAFRRKLDMNQKDFWTRIGVTQSGGCRYESSRLLPKSTAILFDLVYGPEKNVHKKLDALRSFAKSPESS